VDECQTDLVAALAVGFRLKGNQSKEGYRQQNCETTVPQRFATERDPLC
jgi:hypothetical protein